MNTIERPNRAVLSDALDIFRDVMRPFIINALKRVRGKSVEDAIYDALSSYQANEFRHRLQVNGGNVEAAIDIGYFPNLVRRNWKREVFGDQFLADMSVQDKLRIIVQARNHVSHPETDDLDPEYTRGSLYHIAEVLGKINASEAKGKVEKLRDKHFEPAPPKLLEIVSKPNDWNRTVSRNTERAVSSDLSETQLLQKKFWEEFVEYLGVHESSLSPPSPKPQSYMTFGIGRSNFHIAASLSIRGRDIRIWLRMKKKDATAHFYLLKEQQEKIEKEFGEPLEWDELPDTESSKISLCKENTDPTDESDWPNQHEWFASKLELFDKVFRPRIKALNADDWEPPEDEDDE